MAEELGWPGRAPEDIAAWTLVQAAHVTTRRFNAALSEVGLTPTQLGALMTLQLEPGLSGGEIARRIAVTPQSVSELIAGLTEAGLVERDPSPGRGHAIGAHITPSGLRVLRSAYDAVGHIDELGLTADEHRTLNRLLHKVLRAARDDQPPRRRSADDPGTAD